MRGDFPIHLLVGRDLTFRHCAWLTVAASLALSLVGIYAIDVGTAPAAPPMPVTLEGLVLRQSLFLLVGICAGAAIAVPHYRYVRLLAWPAMSIALALLVFLLILFVPASLVTPRNGARAWINLGLVDFQPAEVTKIAYVMVLADYFRYRKNHRTVWGLVPPALITLVPVVLITLQPDLGTAILFIPSLLAILVAAGARLNHLTWVVLIGMVAGLASYPLLKPHQKARIVGLINMVQGNNITGADDINYQSITAKTLSGAGGVSGTPDDKSRALVQFNRLPERHNDMIFAVVVNRFGMLGGLAVLGLYVLWVLGALLTAGASKDPFGRLVIVGCAAILMTQVFINVGMNLGLLPIIGITLPFVSYGGSSMLTVWIMTGLVVSVAMRRPQRLWRPTFEFSGEDDW